MKKGNEVKVASSDAPEAFKGKKGVVWQVGIGLSKKMVSHEICEVKFEDMTDKVWVPANALEVVSQGSDERIFNWRDEVDDKVSDIIVKLTGAKTIESDSLLDDFELWYDWQFEEIRQKLNEAFGIHYVEAISDMTCLDDLVDGVCRMLEINE